MKRILITALLCASVAGCDRRPVINPYADELDPALLVPAQGKLAPGVFVYDGVDGSKIGRVVKVDPDYVFPNGTRGGVLMDWTEKGKDASYWPMQAFDTKLVIPPDAKTQIN